MPLTTNITFDVPGVYVQEDTYGAIPQGLASFNTAYMLGFSSKAGAPVASATFIQSPDDFFNVFGTSASTNSVKLFFDQRSGAGLFFINVPPRAEKTVTVATATAGTTYSLTIDGYTLSYVATATDTSATIIAALANLVNTQASHIALMTGGKVRVAPATVVTSTANITLTNTNAAAYPIAQDVLDCLNVSLDSDLKQGFLFAPEFFQSFTVGTELQALANGMQAFCAQPDYNWLAIADCSLAAATQKTGAGAVNIAKLERNNLTSPKGHLCFYFPYWANTTGQNVPMSASVVGVAIRRYRQEGFRQPPAGTAFPVYGVVDTSFPVTDKVQAQLNPLGINCGRKLSAGRGTVIYGARTVSNNPFYKFLTVRVIMNVLSGTLQKAFEDLVFTSVDGVGVAFLRVQQTCIQICETLRASGALYGASPEEAYLVICDNSNNPATDLENGLVSADVFVKPSPILEVLGIRLNRTSLATNLAEIVQSADISPVKDTGSTQNSGTGSNTAR